jgi:hypothetical protein
MKGGALFKSFLSRPLISRIPGSEQHFYSEHLYAAYRRAGNIFVLLGTFLLYAVLKKKAMDIFCSK